MTQGKNLRTYIIAFKMEDGVVMYLSDQENMMYQVDQAGFWMALDPAMAMGFESREYAAAYLAHYKKIRPHYSKATTWIEKIKLH